MIANVSHLNAISLLGIFVMIGIAVVLSSDRRRISWRLVTMGIGLQVALAAVFFNSQTWTFPKTFTSYQQLVTQADATASVAGRFENDVLTVGDLQTAVDEERFTISQVDEQIAGGIELPRFRNGVVFYVVESFFSVIKRSVEAGTGFVFSANPDGDADDNQTHARAILTTFAFGVLPTVIFFASLMSVLYYLGVMQRLIRLMAWVMQKTLRVSGAESLAAAANVLVGHTEAPLVVKPYIASMTRSELNALMVGGFATISGSLMAIFASVGISAGHLLTASIISAPAALVLAKILQPETETPQTVDAAEAKMEQNATNLLQAAANGASEGLQLALNIAAMLIAFLALIMFIDILLQGAGGLVGLDVSLAKIFGTVFYPLAWIMGIESKDCSIAGDLLGKKMVINEFVAYLQLLGEDSQSLSERSKVILTYALCGFSNFGAIGIQMGGIGPLAPNRKNDIAQLGLRAMIGGMLACCMTACVAGVMYGILR
ncbi:NupC/NupG family nucleoside CNT transporter [Stieleria marina]|uniref:Nucleoside permease NupX n=1 Tax=Stieleria marina TaxID=1930275 RepID=A0A517P399_9BACT|nr:Nucleoside permease NupX [Planctomycetes bacterium K23_9]